MSKRTADCAPPIIPVLLVFSLLALLPTRAEAIPAFSRRYNLKCYACHTIPPVLNQQGYLFRRLGYHLPPALEPGKPTPKISDLVKNEPTWSLGNTAALAVADFGFTAERTTQEGQSPSSTSGFQVGSWNAYFAGWIPDTNFFYYGELDIVTGGQTSPDLPNAKFGYAGGDAHSSWYASGGRSHLQVAEGTRAAGIYSLLPSAPLVFENVSPTAFVLDQSPVGVDLGYTWASPGYRNVFAASVKVTNGDNADGSEVLGPSTRTGKDVWVDVDWWYAPESGVTFVGYRGRKSQIQNNGAPDQFTFNPQIARAGVFANYMLVPDRLDVLGGYMHATDDWQFEPDSPLTHYRSNGYFGEIDYYVQRGLAFVARYDRLNQEIVGGVGPTTLEQWNVGTNCAFTSAGNVVGRLSWGYTKGREPVFGAQTTDRVVQADIAVNF